MIVPGVSDAPRWHTYAACRGMDDGVDWIEVESGSAAAARCKETCRSCPVRLTCALTALIDGERWGVWGGMDEVEHAALMIADPRAAA
jgi:WhiB family transcriptional regulator, redox-sensing transcriptional regulator